MQGYEIRDYSLYLFDMDTTLTETISGKTFPQTVEDRKLMKGRREKLLYLHAVGKRTAIITNQGGRAWQFFEEEAMDAFLKRLVIALEMDAFYVCYRDTGEKARASDKTDKALTVPEYYNGFDRRKPGPGMLLQAMDHFGIDRQDTLMVGDREEDKLAAEAAGTSFMWAWDYFNEGPIIV